MRSRLALIACAAIALALLLAPVALGQEPPHDNGEGLLGETDDRVVTFFSLGVVLFFTLVVIVGSAVQGRLERRKEEQKATRTRQRIGW